MNLKEAFRYQNHLGELLTGALSYLSDRNQTTSVEQRHLKSKMNTGEEDDVLTTDQVREGRGTHFDNNAIVDFAIFILNERNKLAIAIAEAKSSSEFKMDAELSINKDRQRIVRTLLMMSSIKPHTKTSRGSSYKFNEEGNQVPYYYDIVEKFDIDFDRSYVRKVAREFSTAADDVSSKADRCLIDTVVNYEAVFDLNDSFEDAVNEYTELMSQKESVAE